MNRGRSFAVALLLAFSTFAADVQVRASDPADGVESFLRGQMQKHRIPGLQFAVVQHGKIVKLGAYGLANIQDSVPVTDHTLFTINSATKSFTGVAILQLVEEGKLDLAAPASRYLDGLPAAWQAVTVRQLLTHTSGLPNVMDGWGRLLVLGDADASRTKVRTLPLEFKPGEKFSYNQTNYLLLGEIINKLSGMPFSQFITDRQLKIAEMPLTAQCGFGDSHDVIAHGARGYSYFRNVGGKITRSDKLGNVFEEFPPELRTAAGMSSTAEEMARWIIALQEGRLLKAKTSLPTLWTSGVLNNGSPGGFGGLLNGYALGWPTAIRPEHRAVGGIGGGRSAFLIYPEEDLAVVILTNLQGSNPESFIDEVAGFYIPDMRASNGFGLSPAVKSLRAELMKRGFEHAVEVAAEAKKKDAKYRLAEVELNNWAYKLVESGQAKNAIEIFKLNVSLNPESWNVYDSLAEGYEALGDKPAAIKNFKRSLELNPKNDNATEHLKKLEPEAAVSTGSDARCPFPPDATIQRIIDDRVADKRAYGIVVATRDASGKTRLYRAGSSGIEGQALDGDSVFDTASITKTFTAALLADMVTKGEVKLDDPVAKYLPATVKMPARGGKQITLADLATHSSGLPMLPSDFSKDNPSEWVGYTVERMYRFLSNYTLTRDIGAKFEYSNVGMGLLGHALALRAGKSWEEAVAERILKPLGMADTGTTFTPEMRRHLVTGHSKTGQIMPYWEVPYFPGMGGLRSTPNDMLKYLAANMDTDASPLGKAFALTRISRRDAWTPKTKIGLAWIIGTGENNAVIWHGGNSFGQGSFIGFDPAKRVCVVVFTNSNSGVADIGLHIIDQKNSLDEDAPALKALRRVLETRGFDHALEVVNEMKAKDAKYQLPENDVNACGYRLLQQERKKEAVEIFKLNVSLYPSSWNVYDSLAEGYEALEEKVLAVKNYKRSLELNPKNDNGTEHLKKLEPAKAGAAVAPASAPGH
jgi:CubicO group peptidase (beta-lactamase class C family)/Tfp pilus assembly protein PilF